MGAARGFSVVDADRAATLRAWVAALIPAAGRRPDAANAGAAEYIDATVALVPSLRSALLEALDAIESLAARRTGVRFSESALEARELLLREFEAADRSDAFNMVRDFTYEAYYGHPDVLTAIEAETGWRGRAPLTGSPLAPFEDSALQRVRALPPRWRQP